jgi:putative membrane protein insertion efficiency factor
MVHPLFVGAGRVVLRLPTLAVIGLIQLYRLAISPLFPSSCIYTPSCSQYTMTAVRRYGVFKGVYLGGRRLLRCHPFHDGGHDPVP